MESRLQPSHSRTKFDQAEPTDLDSNDMKMKDRISIEWQRAIQDKPESHAFDTSGAIFPRQRSLLAEQVDTVRICEYKPALF
jgi:hypothetical protein